MSGKPEMVVDARASLGEGSIWDARTGKLYWDDAYACEVHQFDPATGHDRAWKVGEPIGCIVPRAAGGLVLAVRTGFMAFDPATGRTRLIAAPKEHNPRNQFNDGKCDPAGRFWAGSNESDAGEPGSLYRLDADLSTHLILGGIKISNGIVWSFDRKTMYYIDSDVYKIEAFDYDHPSGNISNRRTVAPVPKDMGVADGATMDTEGKLWVAHWDGWCVARWNPVTGELMEKVAMPVQRPTSVAFGGPGLETLFVTSARTGLEEKALASQPQAGGLFAFKPGVRGLPAFEFAG